MGYPAKAGCPPFFIPEGRTYSPPRRHKLHIVRPAASGGPRSFRCSSSPHKAGFVGAPLGGGNPPVGRAVRFPLTPSKPAKAASEGTGHSMQTLNGLSQPFGLPSERGIAASADAFQAMSFCLRAVRASPVQLGRWTDHKNVIRPRETAWCPCLPTARANLPPAVLPGCGICGCHFSFAKKKQKWACGPERRNGEYRGNLP